MYAIFEAQLRFVYFFKELSRIRNFHRHTCTRAPRVAILLILPHSVPPDANGKVAALAHYASDDQA